MIFDEITEKLRDRLAVSSTALSMIALELGKSGQIAIGNKLMDIVEENIKLIDRVEKLRKEPNGS